MIQIASIGIRRGSAQSGRQFIRATTGTQLRFKSKPREKLPLFFPKEYEFDYKDYPKVEPENYQFRNPYKKYDDQQLRRNFGEPLHPNHDLLDMWSPDVYNFVDDFTALRWFTTFFAGIASAAYAVWYFELYPDRPNFPRSYPHDGLARDLGAKDDSDAHLYRARVDKTAGETSF